MKTRNPVSEISQIIVNLAKAVPPADFQAMFGGIVANVVGTMPEKYWERFSAIEPCGRPGCDCHLTIAPKTVALFKLLREDYKKYGAHETAITE
jgi:hypothetical protein